MKFSPKAIFSETLLRNSVYLMLSTGTMSVLGFVFWLIVAHVYRPAEIGIASTLISSMNFIKYFSLFGFDSTFIRFLAKSKKQSEHIDTGVVISAATAVTASAGYVLLAPHFAPRLGVLHQNALMGVSFVVFCACAAINLLTDSMFVAYRSAGYNLLVDGFISSSVQLALPLALISLGTFGIFAAQGVAGALAMLCSIFLLIKRFRYRPTFKINHTVLREVRRYSLQNYVASLLNTVPFIIIPLIVLNRLGAAPAARYYLAFTMANLLFTVMYAVSQSLFAEGSHDDENLFMLARRAAKLLAALIVPAATVFVIVGPYVLKAFGSTYSQHAHQILLVLAASAPMLATLSIGGAIMRITKRTRALIGINAFYAISVCGLTALWVSRGLVWVAGAWLAGQTLTTIVTLAVLARRVYTRTLA